MGKFTVGQVVLVDFPHSDLKVTKRRPALVLAIAGFDDVILCQITSRPYTSKKAFKIEPSDFLKNQLPTTSYVRPDKLFTADTSIIEGVVGELNSKTKNLILEKVRQLF
jgi:mRNA interferase MazF